ncbi:hypothetical protein [Burkholderia gladioli]|uniref:hypothetical protein n=1 Tax=Burkholderia gladioli TaxID=28095 RepID=UPI00163E51E7|nr:hypothetical protein [Burkholderia gladioli]
MIELTILVEGKYDAAWVQMLVARAFGRTDLRISTTACGGKQSVLGKFHSYINEPPSLSPDRRLVVALIDADTPSLADARQAIESIPTLAHHSDRVFFAVPSIESWLFADTNVAKRFLQRTDTAALDRIQFPDEIPLPKHFAMQVLGGKRGLEGTGLAIMQHMDLDTAISRSPSLRGFLRGLAQLLGGERFGEIPDAERLLGRRLLGVLVKETNPSSRVIYRTMSGERVTAERLANEITQGTPLAKQYAADLLRVARELLAQDAEDK